MARMPLPVQEEIMRRFVLGYFRNTLFQNSQNDYVTMLPVNTPRNHYVARLKIGVLLFCSISISYAAELEGVKFANAYTIPNSDLVLKGVGLLRYKLFFKGYVGALYVPMSATKNDVLKDIPKRLELHYFWDISADKFGKAAAPYLERNVDAGTFVKIEERVKQINGLYKDIRKNDRYSLTYYPGTGTELALNGHVLGIIEGADFADAYFSIWLGRYPLSEEFKRRLLEW